jgi:hypothetical protein
MVERPRLYSIARNPDRDVGAGATKHAAWFGLFNPLPLDHTTKEGGIRKVRVSPGRF